MYHSINQYSKAKLDAEIKDVEKKINRLELTVTNFDSLVEDNKKKLDILRKQLENLKNLLKFIQ